MYIQTILATCRVLLVLGAVLVMSYIAPVTQISAVVSYPTPQLITSQPPQINMSRPAYLQPTALPGLGTQIIRVSDAATFGSGQRYYKHYYSKQQPWNSNGTRIMLTMNGSVASFLNGQTYALELTRNNVPGSPRWSATDPDVLYGVSCATNCNLSRKYTVSTNTNQTLHTFSEFSGLVLGLYEGNLSDDGRYVPLVGFSGSNRVVVIWDLVNNVEVSRKTFTVDLDWATLSPSGNYVIVNTRAPAYEVYDKQMNFLRILSTYAGGHADIGYDTSGNEVIVSGHFEGGRGFIIATTRLDNGAVREELPGSGQTGIYETSNYHISCRNINRPGYCYISHYAGAGPSSAYMFREVYALKLDGTGTVERFSQEFRAESPVDLTHERTAMVVPNRDGSLVLFSSDWGDNSSNAIIYDYVAGVQVLQSPTPTPTPTRHQRLRQGVAPPTLHSTYRQHLPMEALPGRLAVRLAPLQTTAAFQPDPSSDCSRMVQRSDLHTLLTLTSGIWGQDDSATGQTPTGRTNRFAFPQRTTAIRGQTGEATPTASEAAVSPRQHPHQPRFQLPPRVQLHAVNTPQAAQ